MDSSPAVIDALRRAPEIVIPLVREVPSHILKRRPAPRRWSAHEHACHLAHVHALFFDRLDFMLSDPAPVIRPYLPGEQDADDFLLQMDLETALQHFTEDRQR
ncbi:MAG TPA: DinB family protein, partial [Gemmatimonadaceae bacterium]|nr:DinB family protein [Gemmatimonadaceae bacterium]